MGWKVAPLVAPGAGTRRLQVILALGPRTLKAQTLTLSLALRPTLMAKLPSVWSCLNCAAVTSPCSSCCPRNSGLSWVESWVPW